MTETRTETAAQRSKLYYFTEYHGYRYVGRRASDGAALVVRFTAYGNQMFAQVTPDGTCAYPTAPDLSSYVR